MEYLVSVIMPTYKGSKYLDRAIQSVLEQTYFNFELLVIDDNDPDTLEREKTESILRKYEQDERIIYLKHNRNKNGAAARNTGLNVARGRYVTFLDDDDILLSERIEVCIKKLIENPSFDCVFCDVVCVDENLFSTRLVTIRESGNCQRDLLLNSMFMGSGSNIFMTKKSADKLNGFDETFTRHQDLEFMIRFYNHFQSTFIPKIEIIKAKNDAINNPNYLKMKHVKKLLFNKFEKEIKGLNEYDRNLFYNKHNKELLHASIYTKDKSEFKKINSELKPYIDITFKEKMMLKIFQIGLEKTHIFMFIKWLRRRILYVRLRNRIPENVTIYLKKWRSFIINDEN